MSAPPVKVDMARIAHDLRGPLMPLRTATWLLRNESGESARVRELTDIVDRQTDRMARMMDELIEWTRSESGQTPLRRVAVDAATLMDMALCGVAECSVEPRYVDDAAAATPNVDQHRFDQLLGTLIRHALQRDPSHVPDVQVSAEPGQLRVRVSDQGAAPDAAARAALLSEPLPCPFDDGLGLRLLLARRIAEAHGGSLAVDESAPAGSGAGLALVCTLPIGD